MRLSSSSPSSSHFVFEIGYAVAQQILIRQDNIYPVDKFQRCIFYDVVCCLCHSHALRRQTVKNVHFVSNQNKGLSYTYTDCT